MLSFSQMIKLLIRFSLSICIFLLSGYILLSAHTYKENAFTTSISTLIGLEEVNVGITQNTPAYIIDTSSSSTEKSILVELTEIEIREEEDETFSFRKYLEGDKYFTTLFYSLLPENFLINHINRLSTDKYFISPERSLYLFFRVFRL